MAFIHVFNWRTLPYLLSLIFLSFMITLDQTPHFVHGSSRVSPRVFQAFSRCLRSHGPIDSAMLDLSDFLEVEYKYVAKHRKQRGTKSFSFVQHFLGSSGKTHKLGLAHYIQKHVLKDCMRRTRIDSNLMLLLYPLLSSYTILTRDNHFHGAEEMYDVHDRRMCPYTSYVRCNGKSRFRSFSGRCNNLENPLWGSAFTPLKRYLPPDYADGVDSPREGRRSYLPSPREVSRIVHTQAVNPSVYTTSLTMQIAQFVDHDMDRTAISAFSGSNITTSTENIDCGDDGCSTAGEENQDCFPIKVYNHDPLYGDNSKCLMFVRSAGVTNIDCRIGPREQLNQVTSYLDAGHVYGSTEHEANEVRDLRYKTRGRLLMQKHPGSSSHKELLPVDHNATPGECRPTAAAPCFLAGDKRVNEQPGLACIHTIFAREHNRIERTLHHINPHWDGQRLFQETRRILNALWQHMIYNEHLPLLLGPKVLYSYGLQVNGLGHNSVYDKNIDPSIANAFATAAYRYGHSQIKDMLTFVGTDDITTGELFMSQTFLRPEHVYDESNGGADNILRGMFYESAETVDPHITDQVAGRLFAKDPPHGLGTDLPALNLQRGRDHGIQGYAAWREFCGLGRPRTFDDLLRYIPSVMVKRIRQLYRHVEDVDLFVGGMTELHVVGGMVGPTFACIIADQFRRLKYGDRFWYENRATHPYPFTKAQLASIKKVTFAKVICENSEAIDHIQPRVLLHPFRHVYAKLLEMGIENKVWNVYPLYNGQWNDRVPCFTLPDLDLRLWKEY